MNRLVEGTNLHYWRVLLRVEKVNEDSITFIIPGWNSEFPVVLPKKRIPEEVIKLASTQKYFHCYCHLGADTIEELLAKDFYDWEIE